MNIKILIHVMPWDIDYALLMFTQLKKSKYYLPKDVNIILDIELNLTIGSTKSASPYIISEFIDGIKLTGSSVSECELGEILIDKENKVISAPCYMMQADILEVRKNIKKAIDALNLL
jgi:enhancing lycopene biosynthesis protein 2